MITDGEEAQQGGSTSAGSSLGGGRDHRHSLGSWLRPRSRAPGRHDGTLVYRGGWRRPGERRRAHGVGEVRERVRVRKGEAGA
jgi:hypothetical protein